jgi:bifunctional DNA-binding transcriptional regulator/antitoxin component of YhaV-PrlF toxin-antitoxin module
METTRLSSEGQIIIPQTLLDAYRWQPGQELVLVGLGDSILLKAGRPFPPTELNQVAGSLPYAGPAKSLAEMAQAIQKGIKVQSRDNA